MGRTSGAFWSGGVDSGGRCLDTAGQVPPQTRGSWGGFIAGETFLLGVSEEGNIAPPKREKNRKGTHKKGSFLELGDRGRLAET